MSEFSSTDEIVVTSIEALLLLLQHFPSLAGEGIEVSALDGLEKELGDMPYLSRDDFETVATKCRNADEQLSVTDFMNRLSDQNALRARTQSH